MELDKMAGFCTDKDWLNMDINPVPHNCPSSTIPQIVDFSIISVVLRWESRHYCRGKHQQGTRGAWTYFSATSYHSLYRALPMSFPVFDLYV